MFYLEGFKLYYRFGVALITMFKSVIKSGQFQNGSELWAFIQEQGQTNQINFNTLSNLAFASNMAPPRTTIETYANEAKVSLGRGLREPLHYPSKQAIASPLPINTNFDISTSQTLTHNELGLLTSFLPANIQMDEFHLMYATHTHGWDMGTLYDQCNQYANCIILIQAVVSKGIIGCYCPTPISPPSNNVKGDGTCFVFRLDGPHTGCYRWFDHHGKSDISELNANSTTLQYIVCNDSGITVGGSKAHATNAIRLDHGLTKCTSGVSDTYGNPPLIPEEKKQPYDVLHVEIFCKKQKNSFLYKK